MSKCINYENKNDCVAGSTCGFYFKDHTVLYDLLRHVPLRAGAHPSSATQPDTESTTSLDLGVSCQKSFTHRCR